MSVASEIQRIETEKASLAEAIEGKGGSVPAGAKLIDLAAAVESLETTPEGLSEILLDATGVA